MSEGEARARIRATSLNKFSPMPDTAIEKILNLLAEGKFSTQELSEKLDLPLSSVRATLSQLRHMGLVEPVPAEKRGTPFTVTKEGSDYVNKKIEEENVQALKKLKEK